MNALYADVAANDAVPLLKSLFYTINSDLEIDICSVARLSPILSDTFSITVSISDIEFAALVARKIQIARIIGAQSNQPVAIPKISKVLSWNGNEWDFDLDGFLLRMATTNGNGQFWTALSPQLAAFEAGLGETTMDSYVGFHVLEEIVGFVLRERYGVQSNQLTFDWLGRVMRGHANLGVSTAGPYVQILATLNS